MTTENKTTIHWRYGDTTEATVRVWRENWAGDQFEVMSREEWEVLQKQLQQLVLNTQFHDIDED